MRTPSTPADAVHAVATHPNLPAGDDERFTGFGVMGLPFGSGHYLAFRDFPATSFAPAYRSVWHRDPEGTWVFYATTPASQSCSRYFSTATTVPAVQCDITARWTDPWTLVITVPGRLEWTVVARSTRLTRVLSRVGNRLPERAWATPALLAALGRVAGALLRTGRIALSGTAPNGQDYRLAPRLMWQVSQSRATVAGRDIGAPGPLDSPASLGDFRLPQRGICVVGSGHFEVFDPARHRRAEETFSDLVRT